MHVLKTQCPAGISCASLCHKYLVFTCQDILVLNKEVDWHSVSKALKPTLNIQEAKHSCHAQCTCTECITAAALTGHTGDLHEQFEIHRELTQVWLGPVTLEWTMNEQVCVTQDSQCSSWIKVFREATHWQKNISAMQMETSSRQKASSSHALCLLY